MPTLDGKDVLLLPVDAPIKQAWYYGITNECILWAAQNFVNGETVVFPWWAVFYWPEPRWPSLCQRFCFSWGPNQKYPLVGKWQGCQIFTALDASDLPVGIERTKQDYTAAYIRGSSAFCSKKDHFLQRLSAWLEDPKTVFMQGQNCLAASSIHSLLMLMTQTYRFLT